MATNSRRLSQLTAEEFGQLEEQLEELYVKYEDQEDGISSDGLCKFATECNVVNEKLSEADVALVFQAVKLGKKEALNFDRFKVRSTGGDFLDSDASSAHRKLAAKWQFNEGAPTMS